MCHFSVVLGNKGVDHHRRRQSGWDQIRKKFNPCCLVHPRCHHSMLMSQGPLSAGVQQAEQSGHREPDVDS